MLEVRQDVYFQGEVDPHDLTGLKTWVEELENQTPQTVEELSTFIDKLDELNAKISDKGAEIYVAMTSNTADEKASDDYMALQKNVSAYFAPKDFIFKNIILDSPAFEEWVMVNGETGMLMAKILKNDRDLYREENIALGIEVSELSQKYQAIIGGLTVNFQGADRTLAQMSVFLKEPDRSVREAAWQARSEAMIAKKDELNKIFDEMYVLRQQMAKNAGFENYRDYMHQAKARFSYSVSDIYNFHDAVESEMLPLIRELNEERRQKLGVDTLRPWDLSVDLDGKILRPVDNPEDLVPKNIEVMKRVDPMFGRQFASMNETKLLDLFNRKDKAPGGYSYPMRKYGASFIFMNAVGLHGDLTTLVHETGHAMHEFAQANHKYTSFLGLPTEAAELASMGMEMLSMDHWNVFYTNDQDYKKARHDQIEGAIRFFPWDMIVDSFQQKIYTDSGTKAERDLAFKDLMTRFSANAGVDWTGLENEQQIQWLYQLHIFEVPFYYIEYGISQLGALSLYQNYKKDPKKTLEQYKRFLNLGSQKPLAALYEEAGVNLDFSKEHIKSVTEFVREELKKSAQN